MEKLDLIYAHLLAVGFVVMRQAAEAQDRDWLEAEFELLHNIPSLIGEANPERHRYFWSQERPHYIEWVSASGHEQSRARMLTYYKPIWDEMEPLMAQLTAPAGTRQ
jgi:hypothetical protein